MEEINIDEWFGKWFEVEFYKLLLRKLMIKHVLIGLEFIGFSKI